MAGEDLLRSSIAAYNRGDWDASLDHFTEDVEWRAPPNFPDVDRIHGREGLRALWEMGRSIFDQFTMEPEDFTSSGDCLYLRIRFSGQGTGSGMRLSQDVHAVAWFEGDLISRMDYFTSREEALRTAGIAE